MSTETQASAKDLALKLRKDGKKLGEISKELAKSGFKSNRGTPYSVASVGVMLAGKAKAAARKMPARKAAAMPVRGVSSYLNAILNSREFSASDKVDLLKKLLA